MRTEGVAVDEQMERAQVAREAASHGIRGSASAPTVATAAALAATLARFGR
jgi:hypothetical protein